MSNFSDAGSAKPLKQTSSDKNDDETTPMTTKRLIRKRKQALPKTAPKGVPVVLTNQIPTPIYQITRCTRLSPKFSELQTQDQTWFCIKKDDKVGKRTAKSTTVKPTSTNNASQPADTLERGQVSRMNAWYDSQMTSLSSFYSIYPFFRSSKMWMDASRIDFLFNTPDDPMMMRVYYRNMQHKDVLVQSCVLAPLSSESPNPKTAEASPISTNDVYADMDPSVMETPVALSDMNQFVPLLSSHTQHTSLQPALPERLVID